MSHVHVEAARNSSSAMDGHKAKIDHKADFYMEDGFCVFTEKFLLKKESCCGSGCRHCPYDPPHVKNTVKVREEVLQNL